MAAMIAKLLINNPTTPQHSNYVDPDDLSKVVIDGTFDLLSVAEAILVWVTK